MAIGVPAFSVHDSDIYDFRRAIQLRETMAVASRVQKGFELPTAITLPDKPENSFVSDQELQDHIDNRPNAVCAGHVERMQAFDKRPGGSIYPPIWTQDEILEIYPGET